MSAPSKDTGDVYTVTLTLDQETARGVFALKMHRLTGDAWALVNKEEKPGQPLSGWDTLEWVTIADSPKKRGVYSISAVADVPKRGVFAIRMNGVTGEAWALNTKKNESGWRNLEWARIAG